MRARHYGHTQEMRRHFRMHSRSPDKNSTSLEVTGGLASTAAELLARTDRGIRFAWVRFDSSDGQADRITLVCGDCRKECVWPLIIIIFPATWGRNAIQQCAGVWHRRGAEQAEKGQWISPDRRRSDSARQVRSD